MILEDTEQLQVLSNRPELADLHLTMETWELPDRLTRTKLTKDKGTSSHRGRERQEEGTTVMEDKDQDRNNWSQNLTARGQREGGTRTVDGPVQRR